jgi:hypothetical protein
MSKKTKRQVNNVIVREEAPAPIVKASTPTRTPSPSAEFNPDYTYVKYDLKRIGIMAGSFFVLLVALSFFLR